MKNMNTQEFAALDKVQVTAMIPAIVAALEADYKAQGRKANITSLQRIVNRYHGLDNKTCLRHGKIIGERILAGKEMRPSDSLVGSQDIINVIDYCFTREGGFAWPSLRAVVAGMGKPWSLLAKNKPVNPAEEQHLLYLTRLQNFDSKSGDLYTELRDLAEDVRPLSEQIRRK